MKLVLTLLLFVAVAFEFSFAFGEEDHTSFEPGDYTFNGKVICGYDDERPVIRDMAYVRLMENDKWSPDDFVQEARIGKDGNFTLKTVKQMWDPPTPRLEFYLEFHDPCSWEYHDKKDENPNKFWKSGTLRDDAEHTGYAVTYTLRKSIWTGYYVDVTI